MLTHGTPSPIKPNLASEKDKALATPLFLIDGGHSRPMQPIGVLCGTPVPH